ncbi:unnamed protein product [Symbiodinium sp. CCMP2592]|nr:unnamed protein product [Symbiodinium sp. CCMP2592]
MRQERTDVEEVWDGYAVKHLSFLQPISSSVDASEIRRGRVVARCARELDEQCLLNDAAVVTFRLERPLIKMTGHLSVRGSSHKADGRNISDWPASVDVRCHQRSMLMERRLVLRLSQVHCADRALRLLQGRNQIS